jgi:hypothetical protein
MLDLEKAYDATYDELNLYKSTALPYVKTKLAVGKVPAST